MFRLFRHSLLAVLTVCMLLCGLGHELADRFEMHSHCAIDETCCEEQQSDRESTPDEDGKSCDHALCAHHVAALMESPPSGVIRSWVAEARVVDRFLRPPGVDPADIDHPPQLG